MLTERAFRLATVFIFLSDVLTGSGDCLVLFKSCSTRAFPAVVPRRESGVLFLSARCLRVRHAVAASSPPNTSLVRCYRSKAPCVACGLIFVCVVVARGAPPLSAAVSPHSPHTRVAILLSERRPHRQTSTVCVAAVLAKRCRANRAWPRQ